MNRRRPEPLAVPEEKKASYVLTNAGKFTEGDLTISKDGLQIISPVSARSSSASSQEAVRAITPEVNPATGPDLTLQDLEELGIIGSGSSGVAKKVRNRHTGALLVLKVIQFDVSSDTIRKQVTTELRTLYGASHQNIVKYHQAFFDNGAITIVMEYCDGGSLADVLRAVSRTRPGQAVPEKYIAEIARQVPDMLVKAWHAAGLQREHPCMPDTMTWMTGRSLRHTMVVAGLVHLHKELHVVHRDIKPSNLLLTSTGALKISDFGVSGQLTSSVSNCLSWVGTVTYMSPERIKGDQYSFDSDMWSLGLTLVECALGRFPYPPPGDPSAAQQPLGFWELLEYIVEEAVPVLPRGDPRFSAELCDFVAKCLVKDARQRATIDVLSKHAFLRTHKGTNLAELLSWAVNAS
ncbi:kinase-like domain-containing protein [Haematococcus lacustris]